MFFAHRDYPTSYCNLLQILTLENIYKLKLAFIFIKSKLISQSPQKFSLELLH